MPHVNELKQRKESRMVPETYKSILNMWQNRECRISGSSYCNFIETDRISISLKFAFYFTSVKNTSFSYKENGISKSNEFKSSDKIQSDISLIGFHFVHIRFFSLSVQNTFFQWIQLIENPERSVRHCREIAFPSFSRDRSIVRAGGCVPRGPCTIKGLTISGLDHPVAAPQLHRSKLRIGGHSIAPAHVGGHKKENVLTINRLYLLKRLIEEEEKEK
ncbi:adenylyl cyclase-associated protein 1 isoform X2 [Vespula squamosa]|uniref:Adenylyl cyclase-associated protein 1 isoform X2 n=1 Tax=Vespula squamosa TaxID=30214 RepID=A0ABD2A3N3_VESSQ